jgi:hypothetical protein
LGQIKIKINKKYMKTIIQKIKYAWIIGFLGTVAVVAMPAYASAATIYVQASRTTLSVGDTAIVSVKIDAGGAVLNAVSGTIGLKSSSATSPALSVQQFSLGGSAFGLWPRTPSLSADGSSITFVGGVPGGFSIEGATMFSIVVTATSTGTVTITPQNMSVYANDGKGTLVPTQLKGLAITVVPAKAGVAPVNDWTNLIASDKTAPQPFIIVLGQDPSIFNGAKFAYFSAVDNVSGIDHYEVSENGGQYVRSGSTYVLQNQTGPVTLSVVAYNKAGLSTLATYGISSSTSIFASTPVAVKLIALIIAVLLVVIIAAIVWFAVRKRSSKNVQKNP